MVYMKGKNAKKFRQGVEYGSARWGTAKDIAPFIDPVFENNIPVSYTHLLFTCRDYVYEAGRKITVVKEDFFDNQPWYVRLILEGEDRLCRNRERCV